MTSTLTRRPATTEQAGPPRPVWVSAVLAALASAAAGTVVVVAISVVGWLVSTGGSVGEAMRVGATAWLVGHGSGVSVAGVEVGAVPLGLVALVWWATARVARVLVVPSRIDGLRGLLELATVGAVVYAAWACVLAVVGTPDGADVDLLRAAGATFVVAFTALGWGAARGSGCARALWDAAPAVARGVLAGAGASLGALLAAATVVLLVSLGADLETASRLWGSLEPGVVGGVLLALLCLVLLPNLVLWSVAVLLGPGFVLGADTAVTLQGADLGAVPALPVLAALPAPGPFPGWAVTLSAVPVVAGLLGGWCTARRLVHGPWTHALAAGAGGGAVAGVLLSVLLAVSGGTVGPGRMAETGPDLLPSVALAVLTLAVGGALGSLAGHYGGARASVAAPRD